MKPEEYRLIMRNLELHYQDYMRDSQNSQLFGPDDRMQVEEDYTKAMQQFDTLLHTMEKGNIHSLGLVVVAFSQKGICKEGVFKHRPYVLCTFQE